jgi:RNA polymerase sigma-70 factor (ECF subfamily)
MKDAILTRLFMRFRERGNGKALAAVFDLTAKELLAVAAHLAPSAAEAEDLVQLVYLRAIERAKSFDRAQGLRPWLYGILWREAMGARRRAARRPDADELDRAAVADPAEIAAGSELTAAVRVALDDMPARYKEVLEPLLLEQKPAREIAATLGRSSGTVRMQIHRGLERLRRSLPRGLSAYGIGVLPTRGWQQMRLGVLRAAGITPQSAAPLSTCVLAAQAAFAVAPALWLAPISAGVATLVATHSPIFHSSNEPAPAVASASNPEEIDSMKTAAALALSLALGFSSSSAQDASNREPIAHESAAEKVQRLDALVGELLTCSRENNAEARVAWAGLDAARRRIEAEIRARQQAEAELARSGYNAQEDWVAAASQLQDPARRAQALLEIEAALVSGSAERQLAACRALTRLHEVKFDKQPFREPVLALARSSEGALRIAALYALNCTERRPEDLSLALALVEDDSPAARESGLHLLYVYSDGDLTGATGAAALRMLQADESRRGINGLWGARVSPEISEYLLEMSRSKDRDEAHSAIYFGLSTLEDKSPAVVERLIELASDTDYENAWRARWGLGHGVPPEQGALVAAGMRELFEARSEPALQVELLGLIGRYATSDYLAWLQGIESDTAQPDSVRTAARAAMDAVRER